MKIDDFKAWFEKEYKKNGKSSPYSSNDLIEFMKLNQLTINVPVRKDPYNPEPIHNIID